jgi:hypothetical protein
MHDRDCLHRFMFERYPIRGHLVHLDAAWRALIEHRDYPGSIREALGEAVAASLLLAATIKFEGVLSLQMQGDGPVHLILAQCTGGLGVRGLARYREAGDTAALTAAASDAAASGAARLHRRIVRRTEGMLRVVTGGAGHFAGGRQGRIEEQRTADVRHGRNRGGFFEGIGIEGRASVGERRTGDPGQSGADYRCSHARSALRVTHRRRVLGSPPCDPPIVGEDAPQSAAGGDFSPPPRR